MDQKAKRIEGGDQGRGAQAVANLPHPSEIHYRRRPRGALLPAVVLARLGAYLTVWPMRQPQGSSSIIQTVGEAATSYPPTNQTK